MASPNDVLLKWPNCDVFTHYSFLSFHLPETQASLQPQPSASPFDTHKTSTFYARTFHDRHSMDWFKWKSEPETIDFPIKYGAFHGPGLNHRFSHGFPVNFPWNQSMTAMPLICSTHNDGASHRIADMIRPTHRRFGDSFGVRCSSLFYQVSLWVVYIHIYILHMYVYIIYIYVYIYVYIYMYIYIDIAVSHWQLKIQQLCLNVIARYSCSCASLSTMIIPAYTGSIASYNEQSTMVFLMIHMNFRVLVKTTCGCTSGF